MSDATASAEDLVHQASGWSNALLARVYQGPGDTLEAAMHRAAERYDVPAQAFWTLRYRRPRDVLASVYLKLKAAYETECERQEARLRHELEITKALPETPARRALIREVESVLGQAQGGQTTEAGPPPMTNTD